MNAAVNSTSAFDVYTKACRTTPMIEHRDKPSTGISLYRWDLKPVKEVRIPKNGEVTVAVHLGGNSQVRVFTEEGVSQRFSRPGDITLVPSGQPIKYLLDGSVDFATIHFPASAANIFGKNVGDDLLNLRDCLFAVRDDYVIASVLALFNATHSASSLSKRYSRSVLESLSWHLLRLVSEQKFDPVRLPEPGSQISFNKGGNNFSIIAEEIENRLSEPLKIEALADRAGMGRTTFCEQFTKHFGTPPHRFIVDRRIAKAKQLLIESHYSITDIAYELGFSSASHFSSTFKSTIGITPKNYQIQFGKRFLENTKPQH
ncbi:DNA-binding domain-containing protein, AraC-type [Spongiibacter sp. IMCC21906]|jgi:AraC family transcriptional regulator|uniref:AraC family transcriptional regulator n=1 Tax=Spongiibacter sp. IMCC21906 TaxID=1620392 RepID=UPI00062DF627|nr:AraC family transcriptional regulator [Spongiibacter sp. IMCC21906]AKH67772.1 DNA-binding domain-containing protein, AraC-type [Spongiibacter sp. IMCC21906]